jgi:phospholipid/cholesterol/gamma-HCH transport system substrate-binding protein
MISRTTRIQLFVFALITVLGISYVGAKYAQLDRLFTDETYTVSADLPESGGIYVGAEVTYRGVSVGRVENLRLHDGGVYADLGIRHSDDAIPSDVVAVVANRSAIGEQYVDLQPQSDTGPYLQDGSRIERDDTRTPLAATELLVDLDSFVNGVDKGDLRTVIDELGTAFEGTGPDIATIIDTSNSFIETAYANLGVTKELIKNSRVALMTQLDSESSIRSFSHDLSLFTTTLRDSDKDLRTVIDKGSLAARDVRDLIDDNRNTLAELINNLITTSEISSARVAGIRQVLVLYPYVVEGGYTVVAKDPTTHLYDAHFGLVLTQNPPVCHQGYGTPPRDPNDLSEVPMNENARCTEPQAKSNARGAQNAPAYNRTPVVAKYDPQTGNLVATSTAPRSNVHEVGGQQRLLGKDSWKWLLLGPLATRTPR